MTTARAPQRGGRAGDPASTTLATGSGHGAPAAIKTEATGLDPVSLLRGLVSLQRATGMYPAGHPAIAQKLKDLDEAIQQHLQINPTLQIDLIRGDVHLDGISLGADQQATAEVVKPLTDLGVHSLHVQRGVQPDEILAVATFLSQLKEDAGDESIGGRLARCDVRHVSLGRIVPLDTRWRASEWPDAPTGPLDPAYAQSLLLAQQTFESVASGRRLDVVTVRDLVELLICEVARSSAALGQILALKQYENLTYCHSVNVAMLSLLLGRQLGLDQPTTTVLVEAALLHDIGKTQIPLEIVKKPGALDKRERKLIEAHTIFGAEMLIEIDGLRPLTATVALEHHRSVKGGGYPDLGPGAIPHVLSQIVSIADVYEALTGARSYQDPRLPEQACLILARIAGEKLNTAMVKAFVNAITFFPLGSLVRTSCGEIGVVIRTNPSDPLHPVLTLVDDSLEAPRGEIDSSTRDEAGAYERHIVETLRPLGRELDLTKFFAPAPTVVQQTQDCRIAGLQNCRE